MINQSISVLDKGYVRLVDTLGTDLSIVNAARVSYDKESDELTDKDIGLLKYLVKEGHWSPFRHTALTFEVYAPLMVARQWWKHTVASTHIDEQNGWNESSRRYITEKEEFYVPTERQWRSKPKNSKQGSGEPIDRHLGAWYTEELENLIKYSQDLYENALRNNVAPELARLFLPAYGMYVRWRWTVSLQGVFTFLNQRLEHEAQVEIQEYAKAVKQLSDEAYPKTFSVLYDKNNY